MKFPRPPGADSRNSDNFMRLSILIVNWNTKELVRKCLNSVLENPPAGDFEAVVVDNNSSDGSKEILQKEFGSEKQVKLIFSDKNLGFAAGNNLAYKYSSGDYILLLNPDTEVGAGALGELVNYLDGKPDVGIAGPKLLNPDGSLQPSVRRFPDLWSSMLVFSGLHRIFRPKRYLMDGFDCAREQEVDQVMGAALMTRRKIVERVGLFDEKFFLWYEEVDFCKRVKRVSYKVMYYPEVEITHHTAQSFSQLQLWDRKKTAARSLLYYFRKNGNAPEVVLLYLMMPPVLLIAWLLSGFGIKNRIKV